MGFQHPNMYLVLFALVLLYAAPTTAFGAGNIASISKIEGHNWRHGDIEDMLKTIAFIKGHKWTSMMIKRVYFGNWLRDYSQAMDVGSLKGVQSGTIRILVWILSFLRLVPVLHTHSPMRSIFGLDLRFRSSQDLNHVSKSAYMSRRGMLTLAFIAALAMLLPSLR